MRNLIFAMLLSFLCSFVVSAAPPEPVKFSKGKYSIEKQINAFVSIAAPDNLKNSETESVRCRISLEGILNYNHIEIKKATSFSHRAIVEKPGWDIKSAKSLRYKSNSTANLALKVYRCQS